MEDMFEPANNNESLVTRDGFGHEKPYNGNSVDWITPQWIVNAFPPGWFDLDPCASVSQPWPCARESYTVEQDGLSKPFYGNVWLNPPYGPHAYKWVERLVAHGNGIALIFARVETKLWQELIFPTAGCYLFLRGRVQFSRPDGTTPNSSSGAPSALIGLGLNNTEMLFDLCYLSELPGAYFNGAFCSGQELRTLKREEVEKEPEELTLNM